MANAQGTNKTEPAVERTKSNKNPSKVSPISPKNGVSPRRSRSSEKVQFSNPEIEHNFSLNTQEAIRMYTRNFNNMSLGLFNIMINTTRLESLGVRGAVAETRKAVESAMDLPTKECDVTLSAIDAMLKEAKEKQGVSSVKYTNPREFTTMTRTPEATRLILMFRRFDKAIASLDEAYLNALAPADDVADTKSRLISLIQALAKTIKVHAEASVDQVNSKGKASENAEVHQAEQTETTQSLVKQSDGGDSIEEAPTSIDTAPPVAN